MFIILKIMILPIVIAFLTAFGLTTIELSKRNPTPVHVLGESLETSAVLFPYGPPLLD
jgi:hypothetical protein